MAWTTPATYIAGQVVTAANLNLIRDNLNALYSPASLGAGFKNLLINAVGFPVWQRGTAAFSATGYTADRWLLTVGSGATCSVAQGTTTAPIQTGQAWGLATSAAATLTWNRTVAGTVASTLEQRIEGAASADGQAVTFTVYAATAAGSIDFNAALSQVFGSGGSATVTATGPTWTATTTPQKFSWTTTLPSTSGKTFGAGHYLSALLNRAFNSANGATGQLIVYAVQVEQGSNFTAFEGRPPSAELGLCQRYYYRITATSTSYSVCNYSYGSTSVGYGIVPLPVTMRAAPALGFSSAAHFSTFTTGAVATAASSTSGSAPNGSDSIRLSLTTTAVGANTANGYAFINTVGGWLEANAEL